jgi:hypothetical protein
MGLMNEQSGKLAQYSNRSDLGSATSPIVVGARFRMSALGAARNPHLAEKVGTIVGSSRLNTSLRVLFDGRKSPMSLHRDYIEQISHEAN